MNILSFDVESNGLHGEAFSVAGVLLSEDRQIISQFVSRCPIIGPVDAWVSENVLKPMQSIPVSAPNARSLRDEFWQWYMQSRKDPVMIVAANPYPVEARFLIACQNDAMSSREFEHPFPYYDLSSMLFSLGYVSPEDRSVFVKKAVRDSTGDSHNPLWDAKSAAYTAHAIMRLSKN